MPLTRREWKIYAARVRGYEKNSMPVIFALQVIAEKLPNRVGTKIAQE